MGQAFFSSVTTFCVPHFRPSQEAVKWPRFWAQSVGVDLVSWVDCQWDGAVGGGGEWHI